MNKIILSIALLVVFTASSYAEEAVTTALTATVTPTPKNNIRTTNTLKNIETLKNTTEDKLTDLKTRANKEIDRRIEALNKLITRLEGMKRLSEDDLNSLKVQIQKNIDDLNALKTKINADTDLETLKTDVKSIVDDYRIFAFFLQYINLNSAYDRSIVVQMNMQTVYDKLLARVNEAKAAGKDTAAIENLLKEMKDNLDTALTDIQETKAEIAVLNAEGYPDNKTTLTNARAKLTEIKSNLNQAHIASKEIIKDLRELSKAVKPTSAVPTSITPTSVITPTATP